MEEIPTFDVRPGSDWRKEQAAIASLQYGIVSFPRSGHNWLSRMLAEIIRQTGGHNESAAIGSNGGMGKFIGLKSHRPSQVEPLKEFYHPFPVVYGSHGDTLHDGYEPSTKVYLYRGFWAVWKSTKKAAADTAEIMPDPHGPWWGRNFFHFAYMYFSHRRRFRHVPLKIRYEDLQRDTAGILRLICDDMGVYEVTDEVIASAVRCGSKANMLREQELYGSPNPFQTVNPDNYKIPIKAGASA